MVNAGDIIEAVRASGFETDQDDRAFIFLNVIQRKVIGDHRWRFLRTTATSAAVAGTATYALPANVMHLMSVRLATPGDTTPPELEWIDDDRLLALAAVDPALQQYTAPRFWSDIDPATIELFPAPLVPGTVAIRYLRRVADITSEGDVPEVPNEYLDVLRAGICWKLAQRERPADVPTFKAEFDEILAAMKGQYGLRQTQNAHHVVESGRYPSRYGMSGFSGGWR